MQLAGSCTLFWALVVVLLNCSGGVDGVLTDIAPVERGKWSHFPPFFLTLPFRDGATPGGTEAPVAQGPTHGRGHCGRAPTS